MNNTKNQSINQSLKLFALAPNSKIPLKGSNGLNGPFFSKEEAATHLQQGGNIGAVMGQGLICFDADVKHNEHVCFQFEAYLDAHSVDLNQIIIVDTPSGGRHYYFKSDAPLPTLPHGRFTKVVGVEVKAAGGYVVLPPSKIEGNQYKYASELSEITHKDEPLKLPESILQELLAIKPIREKVTQLDQNKRHDESEGNIENAIKYLHGAIHNNGWEDLKEGNRNSALFQMAAFHRDFAISIKTWAKILRTEWYDKQTNKLSEDEFMQTIKSAEKSASNIWGAKRKEEKKEETKRKKEEERAITKDYNDLIERRTGTLKRDLFSDGLKYWEQKVKRWESPDNLINLFRAHGDSIEENTKKKFTYRRYEPILAQIYDSASPEMLFMPPEWDGGSRIDIMAQSLVLSAHEEREQVGFTLQVVQELLKDWMAKAWARFYDPSIRNRVLILSGPQGIGKDWWINTLTDGAGQWSKDLTIGKEEKDNLLQLKDSAFLKIAEFDRASKLEMSHIKHMITAETVTARAPYTREARTYKCRCSFISSCNIDDIYRDPTGHTRYLPINIEDVIKQYPRTFEDSRQLLAEAKILAEAGFRASKESERVLANYLTGKKPECFDKQVLECFDEKVEAWIESFFDAITKQKIKERGWITNSELDENSLLEKIAKNCGVPIRTIRVILKKFKRDRYERLEPSGPPVRGFSFKVAED